MQSESCVHSWELANVKPCFLITETCFKCKKVTNYFSFEEHPHIEEYKDGDHFWNVIGNSQSIRFDLQCKTCGKLIVLDNLAGLMMCTACEEDCKVYTLMKDLVYEKETVAPVEKND